MKKLFLASVGYITLPHVINLLPDNPSQLTVAFIPTASNLYTNKSWVFKDRDKLIEMGFSVKVVDIEGKDHEYVDRELKSVDVVFVCGGNTFYLLEKVRQSGFDDVIKEKIEQGVVYIGSSAGSVLVCPTIEAIKGMDDPGAAPGLYSYEGLGIIDYLVLPHFGDDEYSVFYQKLLKRLKHTKYQLLTNEQALMINGSEQTVIKAS